MKMSDQILDVDLLAFETGSEATRRAVIDGVRRSLATGFVYTSTDISEDLLDSAYGMLVEFFSKDQETKTSCIAPVRMVKLVTPVCWLRPLRQAINPIGKKCSIGRRQLLLVIR